MTDDIIQQSLALIDTCIAATSPEDTRILPARSFASLELRKKISNFLRDNAYLLVNRKGAVVNPVYKNLAGLKNTIETVYQAKRTVPLLKLVDESVTKERNRVSQGQPEVKRRGRPPKAKRGIQARTGNAPKPSTTAARPSTKFTSTSQLSASNKTVYTNDAEHESNRSFTLIKQTFGPATGVGIDDRYYMGVVRLFGVNLHIPVGTMVWPIGIKMEQEQDNNDNNDNMDDGSASYNSQNNSNEISDDFESVEEADFSEDLNAMPEDEELLSDGPL